MSIKLQMVALKDLKDSRLKTTLLSLDTALSSHLRNALVVSMIKGENLIPISQKGPQKHSTGSILWQTHPYQTFGVQVEYHAYPSRKTVASEEQEISVDRFTTPMGQWLQQNPMEYEDAFKPAFGVEIQEYNKEIESTAPILSEILEPSKPLVKRPRAARGALNAVPIAPASATVTTSAEGLAAAHNIPENNGTSIDGKYVDVMGQGVCPRKENDQPLQTSVAPKIEPPYMPPKQLLRPDTPLASTTNIVQIGSSDSSEFPATWGREIVRGAKAGLLIDTEGKSDVATTTARNDIKQTMRQKKPQQLVSGSNTEMIRNYEKAAKQVLDLALPRQGPFRFEVSIGRLLISPEASTAEFRKPFALTEWASAFPVKKGVKGLARDKIFTSRITTRSLDAESILSISTQRGRKLFGEEPRERNVTYIIQCTTRTNINVVIEVSQDKSFKVACLRKKLEIPAHCAHYRLKQMKYLSEPSTGIFLCGPGIP